MTDFVEGVGRLADPVKAVDGVDWTAVALSAQEGFVLSRVDGSTPAGLLCEITGLGRDATLEILKGLRAKGIIVIGNEAPAGHVAAAARPAASAGGGNSKSAAAATDAASTNDGAAAPPAQHAQATASGAQGAPADSQLDPWLAVEFEQEEAEGIDLKRAIRLRVRQLFPRLDDMTFFDLLGVPLDADSKVIRRAYFRASKEFHPDRYYTKNCGHYKPMLARIFKQVKAAYEFLLDDSKRDQYRRMILQEHEAERITRDLAQQVAQVADDLAAQDARREAARGGQAVPVAPKARVDDSTGPRPAFDTGQFEQAPAAAPEFGEAHATDPDASGEADGESDFARPDQTTADLSGSAAAENAENAAELERDEAEEGGSYSFVRRRRDTPVSPPPVIAAPEPGTAGESQTAAPEAAAPQAATPAAETGTDPEGTDPEGTDPEGTDPEGTDPTDGRRTPTLRRGRRHRRAEKRKKVPVEPTEEQDPELAARRLADRERRSRMTKSVASNPLVARKRKALTFWEQGLKQYEEGKALAAAASLKLAMTYDPAEDKYRALYEDAVDASRATTAEGFFKRAIFEESVGRYETASKLYQRAADILPKASYLQRAADALMWSGDLATAKEYATQAVQIEPNSVDARLTLAEVYLTSKLKKNARREVDMALRIEPANSDAKELLKKIKKA